MHTVNTSLVLNHGNVFEVCKTELDLFSESPELVGVVRPRGFALLAD